MSAFILLHASAQQHNQMLEVLDKQKKKKRQHHKSRSGDSDLTHRGSTRSSRRSEDTTHSNSHKSSKNRHASETPSLHKNDEFDRQLIRTLSSRETTRSKETYRFGFSNLDKKQDCKSLLLLHKTKLEELRRTHRQVGKGEEETDTLLLSEDDNPLTPVYSNNSSIFSTRDLLNRELMITTSIDLKRDSVNSLIGK